MSAFGVVAGTSESIEGTYSDEDQYGERISLPSSVSEIDEGEYRDIYDDIGYTNSISEKAKRVGKIDESGPNISELSIEDVWKLELFEKSYEIIIGDIERRGKTISGRGTLKDSNFGFMTVSSHSGKLSVTIELPEENTQYALRYNDQIDEHHIYQRSLDEVNSIETNGLYPAENSYLNNGRIKNSVLNTRSPENDHDYESYHGFQREESIESSNSFSSKDVIDSSDSAQSISKATSVEQDTSETVIDTNSDTEIGVMIVYTENAAKWAEDNEGGIENVINEAHERSNIVADNSDLGIDFELVHTGQVDYQEDNSRADLERLTNPQDGYMDEVHQWRLEYGADLVSLFADFDYIGGMGWLLDEADGRTDAGFSMSAVQRASDTHVHIHEMGHNMGAGHHKDQLHRTAGPGLFNYSAGWRDTDNKISTIMTYQSGRAFEDGVNTTWIPYFSNPDIEHPDYGVQIGDPEDADNARTLRETKETVSKYSEITEIEDWKDLHEVRDDLGGYYELVDDLDENTKGYDELIDTEDGWKPIGEKGYSDYYGDYRYPPYAKSFTGFFDGNGHEIKDLYINRSGEDGIGLFGVTNHGAEVMKVGVVDAEIIARDGYNIGLLIGRNDDGKISATHAEGDVSGNWRVGGLVGYNGGTLLNSYAAVDVSGTDDVGGLIGSNPLQTDGWIENCYAIGDVTGNNDVGGLIGSNFGTVTSSFWNVQTSGQDDSDGGTGKMTEEMKDVSTYTDTNTTGLEEPWDFVDSPNDDEGNEEIWDIDEDEGVNDGYPYLRWKYEVEEDDENDILDRIRDETRDIFGGIRDIFDIDLPDRPDNRDIPGFNTVLLLLSVILAVPIYQKNKKTDE